MAKGDSVSELQKEIIASTNKDIKDKLSALTTKYYEKGYNDGVLLASKVFIVNLEALQSQIQTILDKFKREHKL